jgi:hypothetical protein
LEAIGADYASLVERGAALVEAGRSSRDSHPTGGAVMTLPARFSLLHSDLNDFLFASVGDEENGMTLSVVSALTRLGIDPWEEAARLAVLPRALAIEALAPRIALVPIGRTQLSGNFAIAQRLVELLPARGQAHSPNRKETSAEDKKYLHAVMLLACLALGVAVLASML